jgi:hypothetical protein
MKTEIHITATDLKETRRILHDLLKGNASTDDLCSGKLKIKIREGRVKCWL